MKTVKIIVLFLFLISLLGCKNELKEKLIFMPKKLLVNAKIDVSKEENYVLVSMTDTRSIYFPVNPKLDIYVDGQHVEKCDTVNNNLDKSDKIHSNKAFRMRQTEFLVKTKFKAKQKIRFEISADGGKYNVYSEVIVPEAAKILSVDVNPQTSMSNKDDYPYVDIKAKIEDIKGQDNYYYIVGSGIADIQYRNTEDKIFNRKFEKMANIDFSQDFIVNEGLAPKDTTIFNSLRESHQYCFSDKLFRDNVATIVGRIEPISFKRSEGIGITLNADINLTYNLNLVTISKLEYLYIKAIENINSQLVETGLVSPVTIPGNIIGGVGCISISNTFSYPVYNYYRYVN